MFRNKKKILNFSNKVVLTKKAKHIFFCIQHELHNVCVYIYIHSHTKLNIYKPRLTERYLRIV